MKLFPCLVSLQLKVTFTICIEFHRKKMNLIQLPKLSIPSRDSTNHRFGHIELKLASLDLFLFIPSPYFAVSAFNPIESSKDFVLIWFGVTLNRTLHPAFYDFLPESNCISQAKASKDNHDHQHRQWGSASSCDLELSKRLYQTNSRFGYELYWNDKKHWRWSNSIPLIWNPIYRYFYLQTVSSFN